MTVGLDNIFIFLILKKQILWKRLRQNIHFFKIEDTCLQMGGF